MANEKTHPDALLDFAHGELDKEARREVLHHLTRCRECREELARITRLISLATADEPALPEEFFERLREEVTASALEAEEPRTPLELALDRLAATGVPLYVLSARLMEIVLLIAGVPEVHPLPERS